MEKTYYRAFASDGEGVRIFVSRNAWKARRSAEHNAELFGLDPKYPRGVEEIDAATALRECEAIEGYNKFA